MGKDYYDILGVGKDASEEEIRKAYRRMALKYHPDKNSDPRSEERFKEIAEAYEILGDTDKKTAFDRHGVDRVDRGRSREYKRYNGETYAQNAHFHPSDPFDIFSSFFGNQDPFAGMFPHHSTSHPHIRERDVFHGQHSFPTSGIHVSIFEDLPGTGAHSSTTTFMSGGTVHITRTVVGEDGRVRREMRFRTPSASRVDDGYRQEARRQHRPRTTSRSAPHRERRGEPDGAPAQDSRGLHTKTNRERETRIPSCENSSWHQQQNSGDERSGHVPRQRAESYSRQQAESSIRQEMYNNARQRPDCDQPKRQHSDVRQREEHDSRLGENIDAMPKPSRDTRQRSGYDARQTPDYNSRQKSKQDARQGPEYDIRQGPEFVTRQRSKDEARQAKKESSRGGDMSTIVCPLCNDYIAREWIEEHAAVCEGVEHSSVVCPICGQGYHPDIIERHAAHCGESVPI